MSVRALFQVARVDNTPPPYDTIHLKVFYPAQLSGDDLEKSMGIVAADAQQAPFKIVIFFNGINCGPEAYQWLAVKLAEQGLVVVTFAWIAENIPGMVALTPGVDIQRLKPHQYGKGPTASALPALLNVLAQLQSEGVLAGLLDLDHVILGGHSAGGRVAIESADPQFFPQVVGAFAYGAHTVGIMQLGYPAGTILPLPDALPLLLIGGTCDGVIANSGDRYGVTWDHPTTPVTRTFQEGLKGGRDDSYLLLLDGANHFLVTHPFDHTTGRSFLDFPATQPEAPLRDLVVDTISTFIGAHIDSQSAALTMLEQQLRSSHPLIASLERK